MAQKLPNVYQIKVTLSGARPPIWRRLQVWSTTDLAKLHYIIQVAMGWTDSHLHMFVAGNRQYGIPDPDFEDEMISEEGVLINALLKKANDSLMYEYDFGDGWEHKVILEKIIEYTPGQTVPRCITGRRSCPPEDVGGIPGYQEFLEAYIDPDHPEHEEWVEWAGDYFDSERFDVAEVNEILSKKSEKPA